MNGHCVICSETFVPTSDVSATPCGHTFHHKCLSDWLRINATCPKCRTSVCLRHVVQKLYFDVLDTSISENPDYLRDIINSLQVEVIQKDKHIREVETTSSAELIAKIKAQADLRALKVKFAKAESDRSLLQTQMDYISQENVRLNKIRLEHAEIRAQLDACRHINTLLNGNSTEASAILNMYGDSKDSCKQLATFCATLQTQLQKEMGVKRKLQRDVHRATEELCSVQATHATALKNANSKLAASEERLADAETKVTEQSKSIVRLTAGTAKLRVTIKEQDSELSVIREELAVLREREAKSKVHAEVLVSRADRDEDSCILISDEENENSEILFGHISEESPFKQPGKPLRELVGATVEQKPAATSLSSVANIFQQKVTNQVVIAATGHSTGATLSSFSSTSTGAISKKRTTPPVSKPAFSSYGIMKKRALSTALNKPTIARTSQCSSGSGYNGLGGHSKADQFPTGIMRKAFR